MDYYEENVESTDSPESLQLPASYYRLSIMKMKVVSEYLGLAVPFLVTIYYSWVNSQRNVLDIVRKHAKLALLSYGGILHVVRIEALLRLVRLGEEHLNGVQRSDEKEECVECEVLYDPGPGRSVDVIFIHGIKGALTKTWRQGNWSRDTVKLQRLGPSSTIINTPNITPGNEYKRQKQLNRDRDILFRNSEDVVYGTGETHAGSSWNNERTSGNIDDKEEVSSCWPKDWLPLDCPSARIIAVNYTTDPYLWSPFWSNVPPRTTMTERAWEMIAKLMYKGVGEHPIVWVGHSKGGLYIKQMLVNASESRDDRDRRIYESTRGILFYSVPHKGSRCAKFNFLPIILKRSVELTEVQDNCEEILALDRKFKELLEKDEINVFIKSFVETSLTLMFILYVRIVSIESATNDFGEIYGVHLDHRNICKPRNRHCFLYRELIKVINYCEGVHLL